jgi:hypothetical protein
MIATQTPNRNYFLGRAFRAANSVIPTGELAQYPSSQRRDRGNQLIGLSRRYVSRLSTACLALRKRRSLLKKALALWMSLAI